MGADSRPTAGSFGTELATVPGPAEPFHSITLNLHRSFRAHGQQRNYLGPLQPRQAALQGAFTYTEGAPKTATDSQR